jgi:NTE family protein
MFTMAEGRRRFEDELPNEWPDQDLYLCAVDISSGRRIVLGKPGQPPATLRQAVLASSAIPGIYKPVRLGKRVLVDGGAHSTSNLDVAVQAGCDLIIGVVPMAWDTGSTPDVIHQLVRRIPAQMLASERAMATKRGAEVLLLRPSSAELRLHGFNMMRPDGLDRIARSAYDATCRTLATDRFAHTLEALAAHPAA